MPALRAAVRPIYEELGILPQTAAGIQQEAVVAQPPERVA